jgi:outer membrane protein
MLRINGFFIFAASAFAFAGSFIALAPASGLAQEMVQAGPPPAYGTANVVHLTLEQARQTAIENNRALVLAHLNVDEKQHATAGATKDYFPKVMGSVSYFDFNRPLGTVLTTRDGSTINVNVANEQSAISTVFLAQPITKLIAVNALVQVSRADECIAEAQLDKATKDLLSGVTQAFYGLAGARRIQSALQFQVTVVEQQLQSTPAPQLQIGLIQLRQGLLETQGQIRDLNDQLDDLLGFAPGTVLEPVDPVPPMPPVRSPEEAVAMALECNPEIREAEQTIVKAEAAMKIAKMDYLPDVNIIGGYANQTSASYIQPDIGYLGVTASYTFWEWGKKRDVCAQRETDLSLAHQNLLVTRDKVQLDARKSYGSFDQAMQSARLAEQMVRAYGDAERAATTPADVLTAKSATAKSQLDLMKADITYRVAHAQLMGVLGRE